MLEWGSQCVLKGLPTWHACTTKTVGAISKQLFFDNDNLVLVSEVSEVYTLCILKWKKDINDEWSEASSKENNQC